MSRSLLERAAAPLGIVGVACGLLACFAAASRAQDFGGPALLGAAGIGWPEDAGSAEALSLGLPPVASGAGLCAVHTAWYGMPDWTTRSLSLGHGLGAIRFAAGASITGRDELGWRALGVGMGAATTQAGGMLRILARQEPGASEAAISPGSPWRQAEYPIGGGAWAVIVPGARLALSVPRLWDRPAASLPVEPPQAALLFGGPELGVAVALRQDGGVRENAAALRLAQRSFRLYAGARSGPLRSALGATVLWRSWELGMAVELHPVLGSTSRFALASRGP